MKVLKEMDNSLLERKEVQVLIEADSNPGFGIAVKIAEHFKSAPELAVIKKIFSGFGKSEFLIDAYIYKNAEAKSIEPKVKVKKDANAGGAK